MNLRDIKYILSVSALLLTMGLSSCTKDLDVESIDPNTSETPDAQSLFNKCYAEFVLEGNGPGDSELDLGDAGLSVCYRLLWNANELTTDEAICGWTDKGIAEYDYNTYTATNDCLYGLYWRLCFGASICNKYLEACADYDATMTAEVHFIRSLYYYYLLDNFGNPSFADKIAMETPKQAYTYNANYVEGQSYTPAEKLAMGREFLFNWIVNELEENMNGMLSPSVRKKGEANYGRADQSAAWMLLARLYLNAEKYTGTAQWDKAKYYADKVIKESGRSIWMGDDTTAHKSANGQWSAYQMLFMADNDSSGAYDESIFAFILDGASTASWGASTFLFAASWDGYMKAEYPQKTDQAWGGNRTRVDLVEKFISTSKLQTLDFWTTEEIVKAAGDDRALLYGDNAKGNKHFDETTGLWTDVKTRKWTNDDVATFTDGFATTKYTSQRSDGGNVSNTTHNDNDIILMRMAEAFLIYAEAEAREALEEGSATTLAEGTRIINVLRERANNTDLHNTYTLREILDERARELYFEGVRRSDLIRYGYYGGSSYTWQWKGGVHEGSRIDAYLNVFPIPTTELGTNSNLTQNPGY